MYHTSILQFHTANCKNCYKCIRNCPVKAIRVQNQQAQIIEEQCVLCERCTSVCPQHAKVEHNDIPDIQKEIAAGKKVIASVHPAYLFRYGWNSIHSLEKCLQKIGFWKVFDAAQGAFMMKEKYTQFLEIQQQKKLVISSNCPVIVRMIEKKYPRIKEYLAPVYSMMQMHTEYLKEQYPEAILVYVSPCISVMSELNEPQAHMDYVITFRELSNWMNDVPENYLEECEKKEIYLSRMTAVAGGLIQTMIPVDGQKYLSVDGIDQCKEILRELQTGGYENYFIEMNACKNGCIGGPYSQKREKKLLDALIGIRESSMENGQPDYQRDYHIEIPEVPERKFVQEEIYPGKTVTKEQITHVLQEMGKYTKEDELNCGACGYDTCREKAVAVIQGKAEVSMCIPYMREKQEDYANIIINAMPGLLVTVDYDLNIVQLNKAANDLFDITRKKHLLGKQAGEIMDDYAMVNMIAFEREIVQDCIYLEEQKRYIERVLTNDRKNKLILCIMKDVTKEKEWEKKQKRAKINAVQMADKLAEEQLRIVHEIASLLGETAADTKVAVEDLKQTILQEIK
nr:[Fe-Fe] hydrogenase large subunit C-terminal domain-containing protein [uncultured Blautia sp.]